MAASDAVCAVCSVPAKSRCSNCNQAHYCSKEHQKHHWKQHKHDCHPFKVEKNEKLGRCLIATRDIKPYEVILKEGYVVRGPSQNTQPVCLGCLNAVDEAAHVDCERCGWPLCSPTCQHIAEHSSECNLLHSAGNTVSINYFNGSEPHPMYQCVSPIRSLLLKDVAPKKWQQLNELESHQNLRRGSAQWKNDVEGIAKSLPRIFKVEKDKYPEDEIMRITGILQINGHEVPTSDPPHVAIYHKCSLLEHSCSPNVTKSFTKNGSVVLWSTLAIKKGTHLSICYSDALWGTAARQSHLQFTKLFKCQCDRCKDVTEFATNYSALLCTKDDSCNGAVLPVTCESWDDKWQCCKCGGIVEKRRVEIIMDRAGQDLRAMPKASIDACRKYLEHYGKLLYKNHFFLVEVKIQLVQFIGAAVASGSSQNSLQLIDSELLELKIRLASEVIQLVEKLAPTEARILGLMCFEIHSGLSEKARRIPLESADASVELLRLSYEYVERTVNYLQYEPPVLSEGYILKQARENREYLKSFMGF